MEEYIKALHDKMKESIRISSLTAANGIQSAHASLEAVREILSELYTFMDTQDFFDKEIEVRFYKELLPQFRSEQFYYEDLVFIETNRPLGTKKQTIRYFSGLLKEKELFFRRNNFLYRYYCLGRNDLDEELFSKKETQLFRSPLFGTEKEYLSDCSTTLSLIMANERISAFLKKSIRELETGKNETSVPKSHMLWTDSKAALIELAYALHSRGSVNQGKSDVKSIIQILEETFNVETGNFYRTFQSMRIRKKNRTVYLDNLKDSLEKRMDEADME
ncbi:RteC protein [Aquiflexum balticum DSM 16537]|uniref:RteC protein n=1 Tax=Aquiflexum balticum DSM 16537 TaxID=758820 RepID=A0A1W2H8C9_9BACT|nr:RteC domain-containing protein [Aquiflexum balticum]SMD44898.1 RteC protein [Aquiflexum balticum DSM 16537]